MTIRQFGLSVGVAFMLVLGPGVFAQDAGVPGTGVPGTGVSGAGVPGTGVPGTGVSGTGVPGTGAPGTGVPGTGVPGTGVPFDLTQLPKPVDTGQTDNSTEGGQNPSGSESTGRISLNQPSSVRLASLGLEQAPVDGLDRLMWNGSTAQDIIDLYALLPENLASPVLKNRLIHIVLSRSIPPQGSVARSEEMIAHRLAWLKNNARADDMAAFIRHLPDDAIWGAWHEWLVLHDLLTRNDEPACAYAAAQITATLEPLWHKINAFCAVLAGDLGRASFALDILADRGVEDAAYFDLMQNLISKSDETAIATDPLSTEGAISVLNLVLMDTARVDISRSTIEAITSHRTSLGALRYLDDDARILLAVRDFGGVGGVSVSDTSVWSSLPDIGVPISEALTAFGLDGDADATALARFSLWQALRRESPSQAHSDTAHQALIADYRKGGIASLALWQPFIAPGAESEFLGVLLASMLPAPESYKSAEGRFLGALLPDADRQNLNGEALDDMSGAWADLLSFDASRIDADTVIEAGAIDALPLLQALGVRLPPLAWQEAIANHPPLASNQKSLALGHLLALEASASRGLKAQTVLLAGIALGATPPWQLGRDDAARVVAALHGAGLHDTAHRLAREILVGWVLERHFNPPNVG